MKVQLGQQRTIIGFSFIWKVFYSWRHFQKHISQGDASTDIWSVDSGENGMAAIDPMKDLPLHRVFSPRLDPEPRKKKRSIEQLKVDQDLSPPSKRKKSGRQQQQL